MCTGTDLWNAPEVFIPDNEENISFKADIFSFGMVIYECISLMPPHMCHLMDDKENSIKNCDSDVKKTSKTVGKTNMNNMSTTTISDDDDGGGEKEQSMNQLNDNKITNKSNISIITLSDDGDDVDDNIQNAAEKEQPLKDKQNTNESIITLTDGEDDDGIENESSFDIQTVLGTRPPLPEATSLSDDYNIVVELFYMCTNINPEDRPTAKSITDSF